MTVNDVTEKKKSTVRVLKVGFVTPSQSVMLIVIL